MKNKIYSLLLASCLAVLAICGHAQGPGARVLSITNPAQSMGVHIGDVLNRRIEMEVTQPYQISKAAYPVKGTNQDGIELVDFKSHASKHGEKTHYSLELSYQVFANTRLPSVMQLPMEKLALTGGSQALTIAIPAWRFWFSPLVDGDLQHAAINLQPQQQPDLVDIRKYQALLVGSLAMLLLALLAVVYVNADRRWLPFMGGAFAQAHRRIKRLSANQAEARKALLYLHQAFNQSYGRNLFADNIDAFLQAHPGFARMKAEITDFFERSNKSLFTASTYDPAALIRDLALLSKGLRDCERKL
jgi:mxaA protein